MKATIRFAILGTAIITNEWRSTLRLSKTVANTIALPRVFDSTRQLSDVRYIDVVVSVVVACVASMNTYIIECDGVVMAICSGTRCVGAIFAIITNIAYAKPIVAITVQTAIVDAMKQIEVPHIV